MRAILNAYPVSKLATGMYFTINGDGYNKAWMVAGYATEYNGGETALVKGWTLIPREPLFNAPMNSSNTTVGGYKGSKMHTETLYNYGNTLKGILGSTLQNRSVLLSSSMDPAKQSSSGLTGCSNNFAWTYAYCTLPTEAQICGSSIWSNGFDIGEGCTKLPVFNFIRYIYYSRVTISLRTVVSSTSFAAALGYGGVSHGGATNEYGVRPLIYVA